MKNPLQKHSNIIIVTTLEGKLIGVSKSTGNILWSKTVEPHLYVENVPDRVMDQLNPLKSNPSYSGSESLLNGGKELVKANTGSETMHYMPEPLTGNLYYMDEKNALKRLQLSVKQLINAHQPFHNNKHVFMGSKKQSAFLLNPSNGGVVKYYGENKVVDCDFNERSAVYITVTEYKLDIYDKNSQKLVSSIKMVDYGGGKGGAKQQKVYSKFMRQIDFKSPVVGAFDVQGGNEGLDLVKLTFDGRFDIAQNLLPGSTNHIDRLSFHSDIEEIGPYNFRYFFIILLPVLALIGMWMTGLIFQQQKISTAKKNDSADSNENNSIFPAEILDFTNREPETIITSEFSNTENKPQLMTAISVSDTILGYGSHGTVVLKGTFQGRPVAVKRMLQDFYSVADHEVKMLLESDQHPNVVRYYYKETVENFTYMALELCVGTIDDYVMKKDIEQVHLMRKILKLEDIFWQICCGVEHLHSLNIVHRDIKPQNILISGNPGGKIPRILISDFGLGKRLVDGQSSFHHTRGASSGPLGTIGWRAPELLIPESITSKDDDGPWLDHKNNTVACSTNSLRITKKIDIFALGLVFSYVASEGSHPFGEQYHREMNIIKGNFRLSKLDNLKDTMILKDLIKTMISKSASKRYHYR